MGSFSHLIISGYPILTQKNGYVDFVVNSINNSDSYANYFL
jgi:hypothetical protein